MSNKELYNQLRQLKSKPFDNAALTYDQSNDAVRVKINEGVSIVVNTDGDIYVVHKNGKDYVLMTDAIVDAVMLIDTTQTVSNYQEDESHV